MARKKKFGSKRMTWDDLGLVPAVDEDEAAAGSADRPLSEDANDNIDQSGIDDDAAGDDDEIEEYIEDEEEYADFGYSEVKKRASKNDRKEYYKAIFMYATAFIAACIILIKIC